MWTQYYTIRWDLATMMWQIMAFKYIFNKWYSITMRHKLCRAFTLDVLASRPVACIYVIIILPEYTWRGVYWFHLVRLSICGQNGVPSVSSTILAGSILYWHILSNNFKSVSHVYSFFKNKKWSIGKFIKLWLWFCIVLTRDTIWINMGNHGVAGDSLVMQAF